MYAQSIFPGARKHGSLARWIKAHRLRCHSGISSGIPHMRMYLTKVLVVTLGTRPLESFWFQSLQTTPYVRFHQTRRERGGASVGDGPSKKANLESIMHTITRRYVTHIMFVARRWAEGECHAPVLDAMQQNSMTLDRMVNPIHIYNWIRNMLGYLQVPCMMKSRLPKPTHSPDS